MTKFWNKALIILSLIIVCFLINQSIKQNSAEARFGPASNNMLLFWDGGAAPSGWSTVTTYDGKLLRGESVANFGTTGGSATHSGTASVSNGASSAGFTTTTGGGQATDSAYVHSHTSLSVTIEATSSLPRHSGLNLIQFNGGVPAVIPSGAIALFDATVPTGWTRQISLDNLFVMASSTTGSTYGSDTHQHSLTWSSLSAATESSTGVTSNAGAAVSHTHTAPSITYTTSTSTLPVHVGMVVGKANSNTASLPNGMIAMFNYDPGSAWSIISDSGGVLYQKFIRGTTTYTGTSYGNNSHTHDSETSGASGQASSKAKGSSTGGTGISGPTHTHTLTATFNSVDATPSYANVVFAKKSTNVPPSAPTQNSPANSATGVALTPTFTMTTTDPDPDNLSYKVTIYSNSGCTSVVQTNDQSSSSTGWTGTDATCSNSPTSCYSSGTQGSFLTQTPLSAGTQYWWKASAKDPDGSATFTNSSTCNTFTTASITVSGRVYTDEGTTGLNCSTPRTVRVKVNGSGDYSASCSNSPSNGSYTVSTVGAISGDVLTVFLDGASELATTVDVNNGSDVTDLDLYQNTIIVRYDTGSSITNTNLSVYDNDDDPDINFTSNGTPKTLTVLNSNELHIATSKTFAPGGDVTTPYLHIVGTYLGASETLTLTGTAGTLLTRTGTFTATSNSTVMNPNATVTLTSGTFTGSNAFYNLTLSPTLASSGKTYAFGAAASTTGNFTINPTSGSALNLKVNLGGWLDVASTATSTIKGSGAGPATSILSTNGQNNINSGHIDIQTNGTLTASSSTITLNGIASGGTLFTRTGTFTAGNGTASSTVVMNPNATVTLTSGTFTGSNAFHNLTLSPTLVSSGKTYTLSAAINVNGDFNINPTASSALALTVSVTSGSNITMPASAILTVTRTTSATALLSGSNISISVGKIVIENGGTLDALNSSGITLNSTSGTLLTVNSGGTFNTTPGADNNSVTSINTDANLTLTGGTGTFNFGSLALTPGLTANRTYTFGSGAITFDGPKSYLLIQPSTLGGSNRVLTVNLGANISTGADDAIYIKPSTNGAFMALATLDTTASNFSITTGSTTIATNGTLKANGSTITLTSTTSTLFTRTGTFTAGNGTASSTVVMNPNASVTLLSGDFTGSNAFYNLTLSPTLVSSGKTYTFGAAASTTGAVLINPSSATLKTLTVNLTGWLDVASSTATTTISGTGAGPATTTLSTNGQNRINFGHIDIQSGSELIASSTITVKGNWTNNGTFTGTNSTVNFTGSGTQYIRNSNTWYNLTASASSARTITFIAGTTQTIASGGSVVFQGASGSLLTLQSSTASSDWNFSIPAGSSRTVDYTAAIDANATDSAISSTNSTCLRTTNWSCSGSNLTFIINSDSFTTVTPGTPVFATSTLSVDTDNSTGWNVTVLRDDSNTTMDLDSDASVNITDQTAWVPGAATTSAGNAVRISSLDNSQKVLAFRTMSASGTVSFISTTWWGTTDAYIDSATSLWSGFPTTAKKIGESSISSGGSAKLNTVLYYLDIPVSQNTGAYSGSITYTATVNP